LAAAFGLLALVMLAAASALVLAAPTDNTDDPTRLQISHICITPGALLDVHFVLVSPPPNVANWGTVAYTMTVPSGQTINGDAPFEAVHGNVAHYRHYAPNYGAGEYTMIAAHVIVDGVRYDLRNPGPRQVGACTPTSIGLTTFAAQGDALENPRLAIAVVMLGLIVLIGLILRLQYARDSERRRAERLVGPKR
jgi:hypothetical protein